MCVHDLDCLVFASVLILLISFARMMSVRVRSVSSSGISFHFALLLTCNPGAVSSGQM